MSKRKQSRKMKAFHQFLLRSEGDALKEGAVRRQKRLARREIRKEDDTLASALSHFSVKESAAPVGSANKAIDVANARIEGPHPEPPMIGAPILPSDRDVQMAPIEKRGRIRKPSKRNRERRAKLHMRLSKRVAMNDVEPSSSSPKTVKSVRFELKASTK